MNETAEQYTEPIKVHLIKDDTKAAPVAEKTYQCTTTLTTYASSSVPVNILGQAPNRIEANIAVLGVVGTNQNVTLTNSQGAANNVSPTGEGEGSTLQPGQVMRHHGTDDMWMVGVGTGTPTLVSVTQVFKRAC